MAAYESHTIPLLKTLTRFHTTYRVKSKFLLVLFTMCLAGLPPFTQHPHKPKVFPLSRQVLHAACNCFLSLGCLSVSPFPSHAPSPCPLSPSHAGFLWGSQAGNSSPRAFVPAVPASFSSLRSSNSWLLLFTFLPPNFTYSETFPDDLA